MNNILIRIEYYPEYMDKIQSFHYINEKLLNDLNEFLNNEKLFIDNFFRLNKKNYSYLSYDNISINIINDEYLKNLIDNFLNNFDNTCNLLELLIENFENNLENFSEENNSEENILSDELIDSININNIMKCKINNNENQINKILSDNPHLKDNKDLITLL